MTDRNDSAPEEETAQARQREEEEATLRARILAETDDVERVTSQS